MNLPDRQLLEVLFGRRSIRTFQPGQVSDAQVKLLLEAAMSAPSAVAKDPWRFVVVRQPETLKELGGVLSNGAMLPAAGLGIIVCGDLDAAHDHQISYLLQDCAAAIENLLLAVHALGLGGCWLGVHPREARMTKVRSILDLPDVVLPVACVAVGHPGETKEGRTRYREDAVHREHW